jgi:DNA-binding NtrC family response regulator
VFEAAQGGVLFLDEIGELPIAVQSKLLRAIEFGEVQRVGSLQTKRVDVSVIAATNCDLRAEVAAGKFRGDLFYRLNVVDVPMPPLRHRREDIPYLTAAFVRACAARIRKPLTGLTPSAERVLFNARWDGNVRELKNVIERACMLADGAVISERELAGAFPRDAVPAMPSAGRARAADAAVSPRSGDVMMSRSNDVLMSRGGDPTVPLQEIERNHIVDVLRRVNGNRMAAARLLGISRRALYRRLERHHIDDEPARVSARRSLS